MQLIEDKLIMSPAPLDRHQVVVDEIYPELSIFVKKHKMGTTRVAPYDVFFDDKNVFQPDICFIGNENIANIQENGLHGAPNLVIEILSPNTWKYDTMVKKKIYEKFGVEELWLIDPVDKTAKGYRLEEGVYQLFFAEKGQLESKLLGFKVVF